MSRLPGHSKLTSALIAALGSKVPVSMTNDRSSSVTEYDLLAAITAAREADELVSLIEAGEVRPHTGYDALLENAGDRQESAWLRVRKLGLRCGGLPDDLDFDAAFTVRVGDLAIRAANWRHQEPQGSVICAAIVVL